MTSTFLRAHWKHLALLNYEVDPALLEPLVPAGTELDAFDGRVLASMVGFQFLRARVLGVAVPGHRDFEEVNLRFYVRREVAGELRRGVVFVREIVPRRAVAWLANALYHEHYVALPMRHADALAAQREGEVAYEWFTGETWNRLAVRVAGEAFLPAADSHESFVAEHYWGYTRRRDGSTAEYRVDHPRWLLRPVVESELHCDVARLYGAAFEPWLRAAPSSAFLAVGSDVSVHRGRRLADV